jgi:hypothetical protein
MSWNEDRDYYYEQEAAKDAFIDEISTQAIDDFAYERLQSYYMKHPDVIRPAIDAYRTGKALNDLNQHSASFVFFMSAIEIFLKSTVIKPIVYGLVHHDGLAEIVADEAINQTGFNRYEKLLSMLVSEFVKTDIKLICRQNSSTRLMTECKDLQSKRNKIIHQGEDCAAQDTAKAHSVAQAVCSLIVIPMLDALNLTVKDNMVCQKYAWDSFDNSAFSLG